MAFLAHWKIDEGIGGNPTTAIDDQGGGSGQHDGTYDLPWGSAGLFPGGIGGKHLHLYSSGASARGYIGSIGNPSDFRLLGIVSAMLWFHPDTYYGMTAASDLKYLIGCTGADDVGAAENDLWSVEAYFPNLLRVQWETAPGVRVTVTSNNDIYPENGWMHLAIVRYEVVANKWGIKFYVNGALADTQDNAGAGWNPPVGGGSTLPLVGKAVSAYSPRSFNLDSVRVYDDEQSVAQILAIYNAEKPLFEGLPAADLSLPSRNLVVNQYQYARVETGPNATTRENAGFSIV